MMHKLIQNSPPGVNIESEFRYFIGGMLLAFLYSLVFAFRFSNAYWNLFTTHNGVKHLLPESSMPEFDQLFGHCHYGYLILTLSMLGVAAMHYAYHYQGSKSIYLMRRLPNPWELHRRCLFAPVLGMGVSLLAAAATILICFAVYVLVSPEECLPPDQWQKIWSVLL